MDNSFEFRSPAWPGRIFVFSSLPSSNTYLQQHSSDFKHLDVVVAKHQTAGRGRHQRTWVSPPNSSLTFSLKVNFQEEDFIDPHTLPQVMALGLVEYLMTLGIDAQIKWPNDILVGKKKIAGILSEMTVSTSEADDNNDSRGVVTCQLIIGMGVNLNQTREDFSNQGLEGTSVSQFTKINENPQVFLECFLNFLFPFISLWLEEGFDFFIYKYKAKSNIIGQTVTLQKGLESYQVKIIGISKDGFLEVKGEMGKAVVTFGEILI